MVTKTSLTISAVMSEQGWWIEGGGAGSQISKHDAGAGRVRYGRTEGTTMKKKMYDK